MEVDLPEVVAEVRACFDAYEKALVNNDVAALNEMFRDDARTIRYGSGENLYGFSEIMAFRAARSPVALKPLPCAIQIMAAPWREEVALRVAYALEQMGEVIAPRPNL